MYRKLKQCRNLKEIYETVPEEYYEKGSFIVILLMLFMLVEETAARYITRHATLEEMIQYFYCIGYIAILFVGIALAIKIAGVGKNGIKEYLKKNPYDITLIIMLLWGLASTLCSQYTKTAFVGNWFRQSGFRTYLIYASVYICGKQIKQHNVKKNIYLAFGIVSTLQNLLPVTKYLGYYGSRTGAFYNTNHAGYFMTMSIFAIIGYVSVEKKMYMKIAGIIMYIFNIWCLIMNNTFGSYLAVLMGLVFLAVMLLAKYKAINRMAALLIILFIAVSAYTNSKTNIISENFGMTGNDIKKIAENSEDAGAAGTGRWVLWVNAVKYIIKAPVFGSGPDCLDKIDIKTADKNSDRVMMSQPHNEYLQYAAEIGIFAALCYLISLIMIAVCRVKELKKADDSLIYGGAVVFAYCISALFGVIMFNAATYFFFFLGMSSKRHA